MLGSFLRGFGGGAGTGALMMGIFQVVALTGLLHSVALPYMIGMVLCTGVFGGVMAVKREADAAREQQPAGARAHRSGQGHAPSRARSQEYTVPVPVMADEVSGPAQGAWADRVGGGNRSGRIEQILANGSMSDRDRAGAILAEREAAMAAQSQRG